MRPVVRLAGLLGCGLLLTTCQPLSRPTDNTATAEVKDARGRVLGTAKLTEVTGGIRLALEVKGLPAGAKAVHIHEVGTCEAPDFASSGAHFNPGGKQHGLLNPQGPHAGDLPNITVDADGSGRLETFTERVTLRDGASSLFDADGSALVIHAAADDFRTDPIGNSGPRIACGVITKAPRPAP